MSPSGLILPNQKELFVGADELFFSTTDRSGRIRSGNSVFVRISQYSLEELTGAPHNIVRHPEMPAGVFALMWDRLLANRPVGAYVQNMAKDGSKYWVFATVTPLGDGFLSVRMAPQAHLFEVVKRVYQYVANTEREAARNGMARRDVARLGQEQLEHLLNELGFPEHDDFLTEALTAEVAARGRLASETFARPRARGPVADVLTGAGALETQLAGLVKRLEAYKVLSDRLTQSSAGVLDIARGLDRAVVTAQVGSEVVGDTAPVLRNVAKVMATPTHNAMAALERMVPRLAELHTHVTSLRFRIALASLHVDMVAAFAAEVIDGVAPPTSLAEVPLLCDAVSEGVMEMASQGSQVNRNLHEVIAEVGEANERLGEFRRFLGQWQVLVVRNRAERTLGDLMRQIDDEFAASREGIGMLRQLSKEFESSVVPFDATALETQVARIRAAAASTSHYAS